MSLAKSSSQKPAPEAKSWEKAQSPPCITFQTRNGESFIVPYSQILWIIAKLSQEKDQITIRTNHHEVSLEGKHLNELVRLLSEFEIGQIREWPDRRSKVADGLIQSCSVRELENN
jgi:hypothetical protein